MLVVVVMAAVDVYTPFPLTPARVRVTRGAVRGVDRRRREPCVHARMQMQIIF